MSHMAARFFILFAALSVVSCSNLLFHPSKKIVLTPDFVGLDYRDIHITASDNTPLHGWWLHSSQEPLGVVYYLHGNGGNVSSNLGAVHWLVHAGYDVFLLDYRGYGYSAGVSSLNGVVQDIRDGWQWLIEQPDAIEKPKFVYAQSMGASLGGYALATLDTLNVPKAVVLDSGFASMKKVARDAAKKNWITWPLQWPLSWSVSDEFDLEDKISDLARRPLLLMHSKDDRIVPYAHLERLNQASEKKAEVYAYSGPHIDAGKLQVHRNKMLSFFSRHR